MFKTIRFSIIILLGFLCCQSAAAGTADSLFHIIASQPDTVKGKALSELYLYYYAKGEIDSAMEVLDQQITFWQRQGDLEQESKCHWARVALLNNSARYSELAIEAEKQMSWFSGHEIWNRFYQVWQRKCSAFHGLGKVQTSLREAQQMHADALQRGNLVGQAMAYKQMGIVYYDLHQYAHAYDLFRQSGDLLVQAQDSVGILTGVYELQCQSLLALKRYDEVLHAADTWRAYLDQIAPRQGLRVVNGPMCSNYLAKAAAYVGLHKQAEADSCLTAAEQCNHVIPLTLASYGIYSLRMELLMAQNNGAQALVYADSIAMLDEVFDKRKDELRAQALVMVGRAKEAVDIYKRLYEQNDSVFSRDMRMQLDELNTLFKVDELKLQNQLSRQRTMIVVVVLAALALLLLGIFRYRSARQIKKEHKLLLESTEKLEQSYEALRVEQLKAEEASRMKTNFIQQISHEIRTPLNVLSGFTQIVTTPGIELDDETKADISQRITENTGRITGLVNKMLELSDVNSRAVLKRDDIVLAEQIALQAVSNSSIDTDPAILFTMAADDDVKELILTTDQRQAARVLELLLDNARKFTKEGAVCLRIGKTAAQQNASNGFVEFVVEDTGIGVPLEEAEHIFEEFVQLDEYYDGTGIGLTVARSVARRLGGDVVLDTQYEGGARFVFSLPL